MMSRIFGGVPALALLAACATAPISDVHDTGANSESSIDLSKWSLVWSEEFSGNGLDLDTWNIEQNCWGGGNDERQCYTDNPRNLGVADGYLTITARKENFIGVALPEDQLEPGKTPPKAAKDFTSARINTKGKSDWKYGRFEIRAKMPTGQGAWPAIWMLPTDNVYGPWALSGEIDIMEIVNLLEPCEDCPNGVEDKTLGTLHYGGKWPDNTHLSKNTHMDGDIEGFHIFALEWEEGAMRWYVDGREFASQTSETWYSAAEAQGLGPHAPFDQDFFFLLNLAIGGGLPEGLNRGGVDMTGYPKSFVVDWLRVYKRIGDTAH